MRNNNNNNIVSTVEFNDFDRTHVSYNDLWSLCKHFVSVPMTMSNGSGEKRQRKRQHTALYEKQDRNKDVITEAEEVHHGRKENTDWGKDNIGTATDRVRSTCREDRKLEKQKPTKSAAPKISQTPTRQYDLAHHDGSFNSFFYKEAVQRRLRVTSYDSVFTTGETRFSCTVHLYPDILSVK